jgi:hypothetical protein
MKTLILGLTIPTLILLAACADDAEAPTGDEATPTPNALATVCEENPDPATDDLVRVNAPVARDAVSSPLPVQGRIAAFEATFQITIFDADGNILGEEVGMSSEGQTLAPFAEDVPFSVTEETPACLWVYEESARDGSPIHVVQIPVLLLP